VTRFRPIGAQDGRAVFDVFYDAIADVDRRLGDPNAWDPADDAMREDAWAGWRALFDHVGATSDLGWLAEADGVVTGYARSIRRGASRELTEFFVLPGHQGAGIGRQLLARAFPAEPGVHRSIIATLEPSALARYLRTGLGIHTMIAYLEHVPAEAGLPTDERLEVQPMTGSPEETAEIGGLDVAALGHGRDVDHGWLRSHRDGLTFRDGGRLVGYGYVGRGSGNIGTRSGPVLAEDASMQPALLAEIERRAARLGFATLGFWLPLTNTVAVGHLLARGFRIDRFLAAFFADAPLPGGDRYVITSPPFFL
jgi:GNAT superfamily N-acetyltransferase